MQQSFCYWLISSFGSDVQSNTRMGGVFRAIEAAGVRKLFVYHGDLIIP